MSDVLMILSNNRINIRDFNGKTLSEGFAIINAVVDVTGIPQLEMLISKLRSVKGVINVTRQSN